MLDVSESPVARSVTHIVHGSAMNLPSATFDAIRSFIVLAETQNLSEAVRLLGVTRQTIRRHLNLLEELRNNKLFTLETGAYRLTSAGKTEYQALKSIFDSVCWWSEGAVALNPYLETRKFHWADGLYFYSQQWSLTRLMHDGGVILNAVFRAWVDSGGEIGHPAFEKVRQSILVYREQFDSWLCVHVGEQSALATWLGPVWAKSVIGAVLEQDPVANPSDAFVMDAYRRVMDSGGCRYDHVAVRLSRGPDAPREAVNYRRLLLPCSFPDGSPALTVCSVRTNNLDLGPLKGCEFDQMPEDFVME